MPPGGAIIHGMTARGHIFGHLCFFDERLDIWRYVDTGAEVSRTRPCPKCDQMPMVCERCPPESPHDPCLGHIEGAWAACCGHGVKQGVIIWQNEMADD